MFTRNAQASTTSASRSPSVSRTARRFSMQPSVWARMSNSRASVGPRNAPFTELSGCRALTPARNTRFPARRDRAYAVSCGASDRWPPLVSLILVASPVQGSAHASTETSLRSLGGLPRHFPLLGRNVSSGRERERQLVSAEQPFTARWQPFAPMTVRGPVDRTLAGVPRSISRVDFVQSRSS